ncbi:TIGR03618 family F420-dependent PPOX class oxidoreductase [Nocardia sp. NPDC006044]|uniref:TIGR03618 family F420-dependent PPOX class oxidoreductase n=1 Tax=Nocardia sp. NPDC006044 TaxID=3364306 RepID=UPI003697D8DD
MSKDFSADTASADQVDSVPRTLDPEVRRVLDGAPHAHLASLLPDGSPHAIPVYVGTDGDHVVILTGPGSRKARNLRRDPRVALSMTPAEKFFQPVIIRGKVVEWLTGDAAWPIIDRLAMKYTGNPYSRDLERVVARIEPDYQSAG